MNYLLYNDVLYMFYVLYKMVNLYTNQMSPKSIISLVYDCELLSVFRKTRYVMNIILY